MTLELADGRGELFQWDTGRIIEFGEDAVSQAHFTNTEKVINIPYTVEVKNRKVAIPDELLQVPGKLIVYAWVSDTNGGYTKVQVNFPVFARPKPSDYVYTPTEHAGFERLRTEIGDLSTLQTDAKDNLVSAINEAAASGGSADAVLYTPQTLTDEQKKQARENVDAASDFVIKATMGSGNAITLDKTLEQIQEAINDGKKVLVDMAQGPHHAFLPLISNSPDGVLFAAIGPASPFSTVASVSVMAPGNQVYFDSIKMPGLAPNGTMPQVPMAGAPAKDMQIATKKYVDDKECILQSTTPGSTKKFKITVDDSGTITTMEV